MAGLAAILDFETLWKSDVRVTKLIRLVTIQI